MEPGSRMFLGHQVIPLSSLARENLDNLIGQIYELAAVDPVLVCGLSIWSCGLIVVS